MHNRVIQRVAVSLLWLAAVILAAAGEAATPASTSTSLAGSLNPSVFGTAITLTATVSTPAAEPATGTVAFYNGVLLLGKATLASGRAALKVALPAGQWPLKAVYLGDAAHQPSTSSPALSQTVNDTNGAGSFQTAAPYSAGNQPYSVAVGDFKGNGIADLAVADLTGAVEILLGKGDGTFPAAVPKPPNSFSESVIVADFDGDGNLDLATANAFGNVSVLLGNGDGTFNTAVDYPAGTQSAAVAAGDFKGNGNYDLAVADSATGEVYILPGNGDGTFGTAVPYPGGTSLTSVAIGDFNGDGIADLAVADQSSGNVNVLVGNGDGSFQTPSINAVGAGGAGTVVVSDFNGDGIADLAVTFGTSVSVFLGNGDGTFPPTPVGYGTFTSLFGLAAADVNGDSIPDLTATDNSAGFAYALLGNGDGTFTAPASYSAGAGANSVAVADFNGDGIPDLVTANYAAPNVTVLLGVVPSHTQTITFTPIQSVTLTADIENPGSVLPAQVSAQASASSGLAVTFFSRTTSVCVLAPAPSNPSGTVSAFAAGTCSITAAQPGNAVFGAAQPVTQTFTVSPAPQNVFFSGPNPPNFIFGTQTVSVGGVSSSGLPPIFSSGSPGVCMVPSSGGSVAIITTGTCSINETQPGNTVIAPAPTKTQTFTVYPNQSITFGPLNNVTYGISPFTVSATADSGLSVTFASTTPSVCTVAVNTNIVTVVGGGMCSIVASQTGNTTYTAATPVTESFTVSTIAQTISFGFLADQTLGSSPPPLSATASSGLGVKFASNSAPVCTLSGINVKLVAAGTCSITASQSGDATYTAATPVTLTFTVSVAGIQPVAAFLDQMGAPALTFNSSTNFPDAGGFLIGPPGVTQDLSGNAYVVGLDSAGGVHLNSYSFANSTWNGWQYSGGILDTTSGLAAAVDPSGVVWFTGRDIGNRFWINSWNGTVFGGWILVADGIFAGDSIPQIAVPSDGTIYVIGKDIGGRIWSNSYNPANQTFTGWVDRQAVMIGQPSAAAGQDGMVYVAVRNVSSNSPVYIKQIPTSNGAAATNWLNGGGLVDTDPQITSQGGTVYLTALAGNNTVYLLTFSEATQAYGTWSFTNGVLNDTTIAAAAGNVFIAGRDGADRIYWYSVTGSSWFFAGGAGMSSTVLAGGK